MDIHVDIREFLEIHVWIWYEFSDQGILELHSKMWSCFLFFLS